MDESTAMFQKGIDRKQNSRDKITNHSQIGDLFMFDQQFLPGEEGKTIDLDPVVSFNG
jgi:hypothetical protein